MPYKCLTLWQPYASLMAWGIKQYETRGWAPSPAQLTPGEVLLIHAAKRKLGQYEKRLLSSLVPNALKVKRGHTDEQAADLIESMPFGAIVGAFRFIDAHPTDGIKHELSGMEKSFGDYSIDRFAWELDLLQLPPHPIYVTGRQTIWHWNPTFVHVTTEDTTFSVHVRNGIITKTDEVVDDFAGKPLSHLVRAWPSAKFDYNEV